MDRADRHRVCTPPSYGAGGGGERAEIAERRGVFAPQRWYLHCRRPDASGDFDAARRRDREADDVLAANEVMIADVIDRQLVGRDPRDAAALQMEFDRLADKPRRQREGLACLGRQEGVAGGLVRQDRQALGDRAGIFRRQAERGKYRRQGLVRHAMRRAVGVGPVALQTRRGRQRVEAHGVSSHTAALSAEPGGPSP